MAGLPPDDHQDLLSHVPSDPALRVQALESLLAEKGLVDTAAVDAWIDLFENKIGCLPVVEGSRLVGILTESDFVRRFVEEAGRTEGPG